MTTFRVVSALALSVGLAAAAIGQQAVEEERVGIASGKRSNVGRAPKLMEFGTQNATAERITAVAFTPYRSSVAALWSGSGLTRYPTTSALTPYEANINVPTGALITRLEFDYCDTNATNHMTMNLYECDNEGQDCVSILTGGAPLVSEGDGCTWVSDPGLSHEVDNFNNTYSIEVYFSTTDGTNQLAGAIVSYRRQVSPAPALATFLDVPTSSGQFQFIEALVAAGITAGCGSGNYCPNNPVTRGQMAVFFAKALGLHYPN